MVADARAALAQGYTALKIKVGKDLQEDIARVKAIAAAVAGRATLRLDANQGWNARQSVQALQRLEADGVPLELLEQPVKAADIDGMAYVRERIATPLMADESAFDARQALALVQQRAADILNIKLMKTGGLSEARRVADIAALHGVPCMIGCMIETSISVAAAAHLAVARADAIALVDLDGPALCTFDPVLGGTRFEGPHIRLGDGPGLSIGEVRGVQWLPA
ncbi:MAG: L-Ala-D/L-Glu epimerase [Stenotrophomonas maltophilia]|uniref:L-Ala-D/L-Glu epimerase n=1 Tax=Stenotrophomonas maltophilia TaxID=40324 RepID=A0A7V8FF52_STEMA|nr:MAG: L-Ala-D/L-Glu epimerase [Stenotrophomonas maltophilia]